MGLDRNCQQIINLREQGNYFDYRCSDVDQWHQDSVKELAAWKWDLVACFSVLPYVMEPARFLNYLSWLAPQVLIECQYAEDGYGFKWLKGDADMRKWLRDYWSKVTKLGETHIPERNKSRSIWLCEEAR